MVRHRCLDRPCLLTSPRPSPARLQVEHMSLALLRVPLGPSFPHLDASRIRPLCGLLSRTLTQDVCWIYVAPHRYDHPGFQLLEALLGALRVGPRIALAIAMKLTNSELEPGAHAAAIRRLRRAGVEVVMCGEHHWRCEVKYKFEADARLLQWQGASHTGRHTCGDARGNSSTSFSHLLPCPSARLRLA